jgi:hypothetical protein
LKKVFFAAAAAFLISGAGALLAQDSEPSAPAAPPAVSIPDPVTAAYTAFQADAKSVVNGASLRFKTDIDSVVDVTGWQSLRFDNTIVFLGASAANKTGGAKGGFALRAFGGYLGAFYNGNFFSGSGFDNGADDSDFTVKQSRYQRNNDIAIMYGHGTAGGFRLDVLLADGNSYSGSDEYGENVGTVSASLARGATATLQWGKKFDRFTPKVYVGVRWPDYTENEWSGPGDPAGDGKAEMRENGRISLKAEVADLPLGLSFDYQLTVDFPKTIKGSTLYKGYEYSESGAAFNLLNAYLSKTVPLGEKFQLRARPQLQFAFYSNSHKAEEDYEGYTGATSYNTEAPEFIFQLKPIVQLGAQWSPSEKLRLYTGVSAALLRWAVNVKTGKWTDQSGAEHKDKPSSWLVDSFAWSRTELRFAGSYVFNEKVAAEISFETPLLAIGMPGSGAETSVGNPFQAASYLANGQLLLKLTL